MSKAQFPKWLYGADGASKLVHSAEDEAALEGEWHDSPAKVSGADPEPQPAEGGTPADREDTGREPMDVLSGEEASTLRGRLEAQADTLGLKVDKRWSNELLQRKIFELGSS